MKWRKDNIPLQIKKLKKKLKKVEKEFEIAKPLRQVRLLKTGNMIHAILEELKRLDTLKKRINLR